MAETSIISILPELGIGVIAVICLAYVTLKHSDSLKEQRVDFLKALDDRSNKHEEAMMERETALRAVETDVRSSLYTHLSKATHALQENTKVLSRVMNHIEK